MSCSRTLATHQVCPPLFRCVPRLGMGGWMPNGMASLSSKQMVVTTRP